MEHKRMDIYRIDHRMDHKRRICENTRTSFSAGTVTDRLESHRKYRTPGYGNVFDVEGKIFGGSLSLGFPSHSGLATSE